MYRQLDGKFFGTLRKRKNRMVLSDDEWVCFLAKDNAFPATLRFYRDECVRIGAAPAQISGIDALIRRVDQWRAENPDQCKVPDVEPNELAPMGGWE